MSAHVEPQMKLPDVALCDLTEGTKDFLIAHSATGKAIPEVIRDVLARASVAAGFTPSEGGEA